LVDAAGVEAAVAADATGDAVVSATGASALVGCPVLNDVLATPAAAPLPAAVVLGCTPTTCCSDCKRLPNRFCAVPTGTCAAVSVLESEPLDST
jgi:hypothetical protein